jgi:hypothetical protein
VPGPGSSSPRGLLFSSDDLWFSAVDGAGREPWVAESLDLLNPHPVADIAPGAASSMAASDRFAIARRRIVFAADDGQIGREPWEANAGAVSRPIGSGCAHELRLPELRATGPHVGGNVQFNGFAGPNAPGTLGFFMISVPPLQPFPLFGGCRLHLDTPTMFSFLGQSILIDYTAQLPPRSSSTPTRASCGSMCDPRCPIQRTTTSQP